MASSSNPINKPRTFTVFIHHGGHLVNTPYKNQGIWLDYIGGLKYTLHDCDPEEWSLQEITGVLKSLGYKGFVTIFYRKPGIRLNEGLVKVSDDAGAMKIAETAMSICFKEVEVYVIQNGNKEDGVLLTLEEDIVEPGQSEDDSESDSWEWTMEEFRFDDSEDEVDDGCWMKYINDGVEELVENHQIITQDHQSPIGQVAEMHLDVGDKIHSDYESSELNSDEEDSDEDSEGTGKKTKYIKYNPSEMCATFKFQLGMEFTSIKQFKEAIGE